MLLQLNPPIPVSTPRGKGHAVALIDHGHEHGPYWVTFLDQGGESWTFSNREIHGETEGPHLSVVPSNVIPFPTRANRDAVYGMIFSPSSTPDGWEPEPA